MLKLYSIIKVFTFLFIVLIPNDSFSQNLETKEINGKHAFFFKNKKISDFKYDKILPNYRGFYFVINSNKWGVVNSKGDEIIKCEYDTIFYAFGKEFIASLNNKFGTIDTLGSTSIAFEYDEIDYVMNSSEALVKKENQWAFLDKDGKLDYDKDKLVFMHPERFPIFEFCPEYENNYLELKKCSDKKIFEYIESKATYPTHEGAIDGTVVVSFIISTKGEVTKVEILKDPGNGWGRIAKEIIESMKKWIPAEQDGEKVACKLNLAIKFKLK